MAGGIYPKGVLIDGAVYVRGDDRWVFDRGFPVIGKKSPMHTSTST